MKLYRYYKIDTIDTLILILDSVVNNTIRYSNVKKSIDFAEHVRIINNDILKEFFKENPVLRYVSFCKSDKLSYAMMQNFSSAFGIVIEYSVDETEIQKLQSNNSIAFFEVQYIDNPYKKSSENVALLLNNVNNLEDLKEKKLDILRELLCHKHEEFNYEKEVRLITTECKDTTSDYISELPSLQLEKIILCPAFSIYISGNVKQANDVSERAFKETKIILKWVSNAIEIKHRKKKIYFSAREDIDTGGFVIHPVSNLKL